MSQSQNRESRSMNQMNSSQGTISCCTTCLSIFLPCDWGSGSTITLGLFPETTSRPSKYTRKFGMHPSLMGSAHNHFNQWWGFDVGDNTSSPDWSFRLEERMSFLSWVKTRHRSLPSQASQVNRARIRRRTTLKPNTFAQFSINCSTRTPEKTLPFQVIARSISQSASYVQIFGDYPSTPTHTSVSLTLHFRISMIKPLFLWIDSRLERRSITFQSQGIALAQSLPTAVHIEWHAVIEFPARCWAMY